jgi:hypothetical protein
VTGSPLIFDIDYVCSSDSAPASLPGKGKGSVCADTAFIDATVPANAQFRSAGSSAGWTCTPDTNAGSSCRNVLGDLDFDEPGQIQFAVQVNSSVPNGTTTLALLANIDATPTPGLIDPDSYNNADTFSLPLQVAPVAATPSIVPTLDQLGLALLGLLLLGALWAHRNEL